MQNPSSEDTGRFSHSTGVKSPNYGKKHSPETRRKISEAVSAANKNPNPFTLFD